MNVLGKIFVIATLIFSVVAAALIMVVYATRTNWYHAYTHLDAQAKAAKANTEAYGELVHKTREEAAKKQKELADSLQAANSILQKEKDETVRLTAELGKEKATSEKLVQENKGIAEVNNRLQKEGALVKSQLGESNRRVVDLEKDKSVFRNRAVEAEIASAQQKEINERLLEDNERLTREVQGAVAKAATGGRPGAAAANPPLEDLEGVVVEADDQAGGWVTVSLGSNHGLKKDHTLQVFRLAPEGKYLGTIRLYDVRADKAVGKPVNRPLAPIKAGDIVASRIRGG